MVRPLNDSPYLYGFHDPGAERLMNEYGTPGWIIFTEAIGSDPDDDGGCDYSEWANQGFGIIVRLFNGYNGEGSISFSARYPEFAQRCANFVRNSEGCHIWVIGNEPNHPEERPGGVEIVLPGMYAHCYRRCRTAIKALPGHAADQVILAPVAPWNNKTVYPGNANGDWIKYLSDILMILGPTDCDGLALHTYTHGPDPQLVGGDTYMDPPFANRQANFRAYQDFMRAVPLNMRGLPVYITQASQNDEWRNENSGWIQRAYAEVARWNALAGNQKIRALVLFRWQKGIDRWGIQGKAGVIEDFRQALGSEYSWPGPETEARRVNFLSHSMPPDIVAGTAREVLLEFRNDGDTAWIHDGPSAVQIGYRWLDATGKLLRLPEEFDSFTALPETVEPEHEARVRAHFTAPSIPGPYVLRWDLYGNDTGWFNDSGSVPLEVKLTVQSAMRSASAPISFPETGYTAHGPFAAFYRHYSAEVAGFPISDQYLPENTGLQTQEWQRVVMEEYPEGQIRLRAAGEELQQLRRTVAAMQQQIEERLPGSRRVLRLPKPAINDAAADYPAAPGSRQARPLSAIRHLVLHHTGVEASVALRKIAAVHKEMFGALLFHFLVGADGAVLQTYPLGEAPASEQNWAAHGIHIALAGEFEGGALPEPQFEATAQLAAWLTQELRLPFDAVKGAANFLDTPSPGQWEGEGGSKQRLLARMGELVEEKPGGGDAQALQAQVVQLQSALARAEADLGRLQDELEAVRAQAAGLVQQLAESERERERLVARERARGADRSAEAREAT